MTANPDFDAAKAKAAWDRIAASPSTAATEDYVLVDKALAALSRRPAGEVGKLVAELKGDCYCEDCVDQERTAVGDTGSVGVCLHCRAADALTALSSAPVDAEVEELARFCFDKAEMEREDGATGFAKMYGQIGQTLLRQARQLTTERQAWAKVRAEIEKLNTTGKHEYALVLAILAQHTPQAGKEGR